MMKLDYSPLCLVTGATGYVGGRLVPYLLNKGYRVRVLARDPQRLQGRPWTGQVEIIQGDVMQPDTLRNAMHAVDYTYYLVHSMGSGSNFHERDLLAANNFSQAAGEANVKRIIYLGGLGNPQADLSQHLRSRQETGKALCVSGIPVTEFRAGVVVGSGSLSFEMIRYLTERIPIMVCPRWVFTRIQPIGIEEVLAYLVDCLQLPETTGQTIEIGGKDILTYGEMMLGYAQARQLKRYLIAVPVLTPRLSSYWVHWMTPIPASIARPLIEGLKNEVIVRDDKATTLFPQIHPSSYQETVIQALETLNSGKVETVWSDALISSQGDIPPVFLTQQQGMIIERREKLVNAPADSIYRTFSGLGGERGWLALNFAWRLRGILDRLVGGVGFRRGRRHPDEIRVGDAIDFWRVETVKPGQMIRLRAEMKVPGRAWLQFETLPITDSQARLIQTAYFAPKGLGGFIYWYLLYPIHALIFAGLVKKVGNITEERYKQYDPVERPA